MKTVTCRPLRVDPMERQPGSECPGENQMEPLSPRQRLVSDCCEALLPESSEAELLVSVRDLHEAQLVISSGVRIVDFKEPSRGALAACDPSVWRAAATHLAASLRVGGGGVQLSAALGESDTGQELARQVPSEFSFAKVGPSGCQTAQKLASVWEAIGLPQSVELVPVAYADHVAAETICPEQVLGLVIDSGRRRMLVDTFVKDGRTLTDHLSAGELRSLLETAANAGVWMALAGSIRLPEKRSLVAEGVRPDCWGVRGDVCDHRDRAARLDANRVTAWRDSCGLPCVSGVQVGHPGNA
ncbi:(5-formylfuran-3-yl)methyl phosphate synthase [Rhodopirellula sp. P2]|uniref:(5-formylfuran-3-yl)methyl phosphate synthase n=1 Tax=Rhodopirellula sp. P2 TaxID=2127060 RepID=UPI0023684C48|nr:(5-formylfuran-3-yl)methyl phosphate synthase [Rhodopirellula sp. P2]WDQ19324.1 (5-formylfuran-3-yl)methyl phosphate synthase [Rhodopirellula sp. P2]